MKTVSVKLGSIYDIRTLVDCASECDYDIELSSGSYTVDAKSIMGIFGLDLAGAVKLTAYSDNPDIFFTKIRSFIV